MPTRPKNVCAFVRKQREGWSVTIEIANLPSGKSSLGPFAASDASDARDIIAAELTLRGFSPSDYSINWESAYAP